MAGKPRNVRRRIRAAAAGLLILVALASTFTAGAAKERTLRAACPSRCTETVTARSGKYGIVLSLPGFWDITAVTLELDGSDAVYLGSDRVEIRSGEPADLSGFVGQRALLLDAKSRQVGWLTVLQGSRIPALFLEVDGDRLKKVNRSKEEIITEGHAAYYEADGKASYDGGLTQMKGRGNNTFSYPKKPYQIKLKDKATLSGMTAAKTWILLANWTDISLLRNQIMLDVSRASGLRYAVACEQVDVWVNGGYQGLYLMTEKIQIAKGRMEITDLEKATEEANDQDTFPGRIVKRKTKEFPLIRDYPKVKDPEDITGGYIATIEKNHRMKNNDIPGFRTDAVLSVQIKEPSFPSSAQTEYFARLVTETQHALMARDGICPETGKSFEEYLDLESFAKKFLIEDWCKNYDFLGGSQYIYKDSDLVDPLLYAGPAWDYDLAFGNMRDKGHMSSGNYLINFRRDNNIYWLLYTHDSFRAEITRQWQNSFRPAMAVLLGEAPAPEGSIVRPYDEYRDRIAASAAMNFKRWGVNDAATAYEAGKSFEIATKYLKTWITEHTAAMDKLYGPAAEETEK